MSIKKKLRLQNILNQRRIRKLGQGKMLEACDIKECRAPATHKLRYAIWPKGLIAKSTGAHTGDLSLQVCAAHAREIMERNDPRGEARRHFTDRVWASIWRAHRDMGWAEPDRDSAEVFVEPIKPPAKSS